MFDWRLRVFLCVFFFFDLSQVEKERTQWRNRGTFSAGAAFHTRPERFRGKSPSACLSDFAPMLPLIPVGRVWSSRQPLRFCWSERVEGESASFSSLKLAAPEFFALRRQTEDKEKSKKRKGEKWWESYTLESVHLYGRVSQLLGNRYNSWVSRAEIA